MVISNEGVVERIFLHAHETVNAFEDRLTEAIEVRNVGELGVVQLRHLLARFIRIVSLSRESIKSASEN